LFVFVPVLSSIILSFTNFNMLQTPKFIGYQNYANLLLNDEIFLIAIKNTLLIALYNRTCKLFHVLYIGLVDQ